MLENETVLVRVVVNVDNLRRGYEGEVELTPRIQALVAAGYLQILGHLWVAPSPLASPMPPEIPPVALVALETIPEGHTAARRKKPQPGGVSGG